MCMLQFIHIPRFATRTIQHNDSRSINTATAPFYSGRSKGMGWVYLENYNTEGEERAAKAPPRPGYGDYGENKKTEVHARYEQSPFPFSSSHTNKKEQRMYSIAKLLSILPETVTAQDGGSKHVNRMHTQSYTHQTARLGRKGRRTRSVYLRSFNLLSAGHGAHRGRVGALGGGSCEIKEAKQTLGIDVKGNCAEMNDQFYMLRYYQKTTIIITS